MTHLNLCNQLNFNDLYFRRLCRPEKRLPKNGKFYAT